MRITEESWLFSANYWKY